MYIIHTAAQTNYFHLGEIRISNGQATVEITGRSIEAIADPEGNTMQSWTNAIAVPSSAITADVEQSVTTWLISPDGCFSGGQIVSDEDVLFLATRDNLRRRVKDLRDTTRDGGCMTSVGLVDTDINSRINIGGSVTMASILGAEFGSQWRLSDNSMVALDAAGMTNLGLTVGAFVEACQVRKNDLDTLIDACTTVAELEAIDIEAGWPS